MKVSPVQPVEQWPDAEKQWIRWMFRLLLSTGQVKAPGFGYEASQETLEHLYNIGSLKISAEPVRQGNYNLMLYDEKKQAYTVVTKVELALDKPADWDK